MTVRTVLSSPDPPFTWVDVVHPSREELGEIARRYGLHSFETTVFGEHEFAGLLRRICLVKRRVTLMRRMLLHTLDAVEKFRKRGWLGS